MNFDLSKLLKTVFFAGESIIEIYEQDFEVFTKKDNSPLTIADQKSNEILMRFLETTPYPIISEENKQIDYSDRKDWETFWCVDPIDGTKEFIKKNGEFCICVALINKGKPVFGLIYAPVTQEAVFTHDSQVFSIFKSGFLENGLDAKKRITISKNETDVIRVIASRSHLSDQTKDYVEELTKKGKKIEFVSKGSALKFISLAKGEADIYPRFAPTMEWDTAAGHAICSKLGYKIINWETKTELTYNKKILLNPYFLVNL